MTKAIIFHNSVLQNILGRHYKWWYILTYYFKLEGVYFFTNLFHFLGQSIGIFTAIFIWATVDGSSAITTSLVIGLLFYTATGNTIYWIIGHGIEHGVVTKFLITPTSFMRIYFFISTGFLGRVIMYNSIMFVPVLLILRERVVLVSDFRYILPIIIFLMIGFFIRFLCAYLVGLSTFWTTQVYGQGNTYENIMPLLIGLVFPYNIITIGWLKTILIFSPWSFVVYHPLQIYLGNYSIVQILGYFIYSLLWCFLLYFVSKKVFLAGLKRNESVGL
jgi:ABC-type uncharacterized transport system permease subunit